MSASFPVLMLLMGVAMAASIAFPARGADGGAGTRPAAAAAGSDPDPKLSPEQVMHVVLDALKANNADDDGIRTTFRFASPANREMTGPVERFIPMVKNPAYRVLVNHKSAKVGRVEQKGDRAAAFVLVVDANGHAAYFVWQLSRQKEGELKDCWLTDGVAPVESPADDDDAQKA